MKKLVSLLVALSLVVVALATVASATNSPVGDITLVDAPKVEVEGGTLTPAALEKLAEEIEVTPVAKTEDWVAPISTPAGIKEKVGATYDNFNLFQGIEVSLSETGVKILTGEITLSAPKAATISAVTIAETSAKLKNTTVTLNAPGLTKANAPTVVSYDPAAKTYTAIDTTVSGSNLTATVPVAADGIAYVGVIYTGVPQSPSTNVAAWAIGVIAIVALAGAVYAGKKAFVA